MYEFSTEGVDSAFVIVTEKKRILCGVAVNRRCREPLILVETARTPQRNMSDMRFVAPIT